MPSVCPQRPALSPPPDGEPPPSARRRARLAGVGLLVGICVVAGLRAGDGTDSAQRTGVLVLHSYHEGLTWTDGTDEGIREVLGARPDIEVYTEYLDSKRIALEDLPNLLADYLRRKYAAIPIAAIIVSDNYALSFLTTHQKAVFPGLPVIFCGIDDFQPALLDGLDGPATGVVQALNPRRTLRLIRTLQPALRRLAVVSGVDETAQAMKRQAQLALADEADGLEVVWLDSLSTRTLLERLGTLSREDAVLLCNFNRDADGVYYSHEDSARLISGATAAPVYAMQDLYMGTGVVGGSMISARDQGTVAARLCLNTLDTGHTPPIRLECPHTILCDYAVLRRFGMNVSALPPTATVINRPESFYARHRRLIWTTVAAFVLLLLALAGVTFGLLRSRTAGRKLRRSEENLRTTLNSIGDAVIATDIAGRIVHMNPVAERLTAWTSAAAMHRPLAEVFRLVDAETGQSCAAPGREVLQHRGRVEVANHATLLARDGTKHEIAHSAAPIRAARDVVIGVVLVFRDVTEDYRMRRMLAQSEAQMKLALQGADLGTWDWDVTTGQLAFDDRCAEMLGYRREEIEPQAEAWRQRIHPDDRPAVQAALAAHLAGQTPAYETEHRLQHCSGDWVWVLDKGRVIERGPDGSARRVCGTHLDITDRKRAEAERERLQEQLQHAQKLESIGLLAGGVAHDFNNILTAVIGHTELAVDELETRFPAADAALESVREIERNAQRAAALTRQLLAFSRRQVMRPEVLDLNATLRDVEKMLRRLITENITLQLHCAADLHAIKADPGQLEQVILNLVVNARDAMPEGGQLALETRNVLLEDTQVAMPPDLLSGPYVLLAVSDTGCGMDRATRERIFEPFFTTKTLGQGTGLGLSTVYGIVKQAGGHIIAYSELNRGTTFKIYLPAVEGTVVQRELPEAVRPVLTGSGTVLICEDDPAVREVTARTVRDAGYTVLVASGGQEALRLAEAHAQLIDLLITDVIMPGLDGPSLAEAVTALRRDIRTLFVSGYTSNVIARHGVLESAVAFLEKPYSRRQLLQRIHEIMSQPKPVSPQT
ncbi:MAG: PAS domain S-box protein [Phycisphaerae bacterium]|jgi:PAS domain S-box-containing protein